MGADIERALRLMLETIPRDATHGSAPVMAARSGVSVRSGASDARTSKRLIARFGRRHLYSRESAVLCDCAARKRQHKTVDVLRAGTVIGISL
jgi:hypothetical protein